MRPAMLNSTYISPALEGKLSHIEDFPVTTLVAPIGYGKSRAAAWWAERCRKRDGEALILRQVIVTDALGDFWRGFCQNLREWPELEREMRALGFPADRQGRQLLLELLTDALAGTEREVFYLIDDLHFLPNPALPALLGFLAERLGERVHLVLLSRNRIFDRAEEMKLGPRLYALGAENLRLSAQGVRRYAQQAGQVLTEREAEDLAGSTEGWFSMVYLKLRSYAQTGRWPDGIQSIYPLIDEVLFRPLGDRERNFLTRLGVPDEFTAEEARFLWPEEDAEDILAKLTEQNAFITRDGEVYRYHNMLRSCARERFSRMEEGERRDYLRRLGSWYQRTEDYYAAALCYESAGDWEALPRAFFLDQARSITGETLGKMLSWYENCPEEVWKQNPGAMLVMLRKLFSFGRIPEMYRVRDWILAAMKERRDLPEEERNNILGEVELNMSFLAFNDISAMSAYHRRACALMTRPVMGMRGGNWTFGAPSVLMTYHRTAGGLDRENEEMRECMPYFYQVTDGHGNGAEHVMRGETELLRGNWEDAELCWKLAVSAARRKGQYSLWLAADFLKARLLFLQGELGEAEALLAQQDALLRRERRYDLLNTAELCRAWLAAILGREAEDAPRWLRDETEPSPLPRPAAAMVELCRSQILLARRDWGAAAAREEAVLSACRGYRGMLLGEIWGRLQLCAAYEGLGRTETAREHLRGAWEAAEPDGLLLPFAVMEADCPQSLDALRESLSGEVRETLEAFCRQVRHARAAMLGAPVPELLAYGLTEREMEIARMTAQRRTRLEIGEAMGISEKTVSNRLTTVYEKLGLDKVSGKRRALTELLRELGVE